MPRSDPLKLSFISLSSRLLNEVRSVHLKEAKDVVSFRSITFFELRVSIDWILSIRPIGSFYERGIMQVIMLKLSYHKGYQSTTAARFKHLYLYRNVLFELKVICWFNHEYRLTTQTEYFNIPFLCSVWISIFKTLFQYHCPIIN